MREIPFRDWLQRRGLSANTIASRVSNIKTIENSYGDLDQRAALGNLFEVERDIKYSTGDAKQGKPNPSKIPINGNIYNGLATLKSALCLYENFIEIGIRIPKPPEGGLPNKPRLLWPDFGQLNNEEMVQLAKLTTRHICFLHPNIVSDLVKDNELHSEGWSHRLKEKGIEPSLYLWKNSPCAFPGVRRYAGSEEIAIYRGQKKTGARPKNALALDDNDYPKQIWSFVFQGKKFAKRGPLGYSLAHLVDHKDHKNRALDEFNNSDVDSSTSTLFGLYTSPTNTVYIPNGLMRPTDFSFPLRNLIQRRAVALYGSFCKLVPPHLSIKASGSHEWSLDGFDWREPVGTSDHVQSFLTYRNETMEKLLAPRDG